MDVARPSSSVVSQDQPSLQSDQAPRSGSQDGTAHKAAGNMHRISPLNISGDAVTVGQESFQRGKLQLDTTQQLRVYLQAQTPFHGKHVRFHDASTVWCVLTSVARTTG